MASIHPPTSPIPVISNSPTGQAQRSTSPAGVVIGSLIGADSRTIRYPLDGVNSTPTQTAARHDTIDHPQPAAITLTGATPTSTPSTTPVGVRTHSAPWRHQGQLPRPRPLPCDWRFRRPQPVTRTEPSRREERRRSPEPSGIHAHKNGPRVAFPQLRGRFLVWRVMDSNQRRTTPTVLQGGHEIALTSRDAHPQPTSARSPHEQLDRPGAISNHWPGRQPSAFSSHA
jgi:hypothetical protein